MSDNTTTTPPNAANGATPAVCTSQPCPNCWLNDHETEISISSSYARYCRKYKPDGTKYTTAELPTLKMRAKIYAPIKTGTKITVEVRFKVEPQTGAGDTQVNAAKSKLESGVNTHWNGKFSLKVDDPLCGPKTFAVVYKVLWVTSGEHYILRVHRSWPREGEGNGVVNVQDSTTAWIFAHEFGHCVGLPDEYSTRGTADSVRYITPAGALDAAVTAPAVKPPSDPSATIMSTYDNTTTLKRHCWNVAIEVQALLSSALGRAIKCTIS